MKIYFKTHQAMRTFKTGKPVDQGAEKAIHGKRWSRDLKGVVRTGKVVN